MTPKEKKDLQEKMQGLIEEANALGTSDEDNARYDEIKSELDTIAAQLKNARSTETRRTEMKGYDDFLNKPAGGLPHAAKAATPADINGEKKDAGSDTPAAEAGANPARPRIAGLKHFKSEQTAYRFGKWFLGAVCNQPEAKEFCKQSGIQIKTVQTEGINSDGGATVPTEFSNTIIDLREQYGVFRANVMPEPMGSDNMVVPRSVGGLKAYPVGEGQTGTRSKTAWDNVELTARKWMVLARYSTEVNEDSLVNWADRLAYEIAYAFAQSEDEAGFLGDGTSAYHKITGVISRLKGLSATVAYIAGLVEASGNAWGEITLKDFLKVKGRLPAYARARGNAKWFCSTTFHSEVMESLALAAGGATAAEVVAGSGTPRFLGFPVEFAQSLPITEANSQVPCILGDLNMGVALGDRRGITLALSEHSAFSDDVIEIKGTERFDINVHDVGNADATASNRKPGPIVGLITAAS
jgi:HK97 family phage major capsid protein